MNFEELRNSITEQNFRILKNGVVIGGGAYKDLVWSFDSDSQGSTFYVNIMGDNSEIFRVTSGHSTTNIASAINFVLHCLRN